MKNIVNVWVETSPISPFFIKLKYFGKWCEAKCLMCKDCSYEAVRFFLDKLITSLGIRDLMESGC